MTTPNYRKQIVDLLLPHAKADKRIHLLVCDMGFGVVDAFRINWVWMPPWGPEKITDDGRDMMRALGFSI